MATRTLFNLIAFQAGWFAAVVFAAQRDIWTGPVVIAGLVAVQIAVWGRAQWRDEIKLVLGVALFGLVVDSMLEAAGTVRFREVECWGSPPWMIALWANLAATLRVSLAWLEGRPILAAILGAVFGPLSYCAGARMGALTLNPQTGKALVILAVAWAIAMPAILAFSRYVRENPERPVQPAGAASNL